MLFKIKYSSVLCVVTKEGKVRGRCCEGKLAETHDSKGNFLNQSTQKEIMIKRRALSEGAASRAFERSVGGQARGERL